MSIAEQLITRGWNQGATVAEDGTVCLDGAVCLEAGIIFDEVGFEDEHQEPHASAALSAGRKIMNFMLPKEAGHGVASWNDRSGRTFDEVLRFAKEVDEVIDALKELNKQ